MNHYHILANSSEEEVCELASFLLEHYSASQIKLLSGPRQGLVMLRVRETVAESLFNAGEILVTEVKLELDEQFGFGMVIGNQPRKALALALIDAALRKNDALAEQLSLKLAVLYQQIMQYNQREQALVATTRVEFERM